jgi:hypothetical protein
MGQSARRYVSGAHAWSKCLGALDSLVLPAQVCESKFSLSQSECVLA